VVVGGFIGLLPAGGVTWDYIQYPLGLAALGHDVFYIEDTRLWPVYQTDPTSARNVAYLASVMESFGLGERWAYRDEVTGRSYGLPDSRIAEICRTADVFINVSCATVLRDEYRSIPLRILIDSDPMFTQAQYVSSMGFTPGSSGMRELVAGHTHHFTFGLHVGAPDCRVPACGVDWLPTVQPISIERWSNVAEPIDPNPPFTTVMNWAGSRVFTHDGETWGQKNVEFLRVLDLPGMVPGLTLLAAVGQTGGTGTAGFDGETLRRQGWDVRDAASEVPDFEAYRNFIGASRGEFSVAKEAYVKARTGWFSCRSACYLAAGRAAIVQDTGWSAHLPSGTGLLAFHDATSAAEALERVASEPRVHARAARAIAEEYFRDTRVLGEMLRRAGV